MKSCCIHPGCCGRGGAGSKGCCLCRDGRDGDELSGCSSCLCLCLGGLGGDELELDYRKCGGISFSGFSLSIKQDKYPYALYYAYGGPCNSAYKHQVDERVRGVVLGTRHGGGLGVREMGGLNVSSECLIEDRCMHPISSPFLTYRKVEALEIVLFTSFASFITRLVK